MMGIELAHAYDAKIGEVRLTVFVATGKDLQVFEMPRAVERQPHQAVLDKRKHI
jgi:hypothetical protein